VVAALARQTVQDEDSDSDKEDTAEEGNGQVEPEGEDSYTAVAREVQEVLGVVRGLHTASVVPDRFVLVDYQLGQRQEPWHQVRKRQKPEQRPLERKQDGTSTAG
jgi:hypothetical protein